MIGSVFTALGGLGLFLLGMQLLTEGLRALAGARLRAFLRQRTRTPISGAVTGALATALLQSSSATTVATVGFVSAGLMAFPQALGIIFGANIGTTITGWMVVVLGFKLKLGIAALPLVLIGVLLQLFARGRARSVGKALAGFSLLFIGISLLQDGMTVLEGTVTPATFPPDTWLGRLQLVGLGMLVTIITQSSSAGVATALAALSAGAISFPQAAALVIGMDVGTTATAALATLGGSVETRRTGFAHVIYNILTGTMAFVLLSPLARIAAWFQTSAIGFDAQIGLVAFHTAFNLLGVLAVIWVTPQFARLVAALVRSTSTNLTDRLDPRFLKEPETAMDAVVATCLTLSKALGQKLSERLAQPADPPGPADLADIELAISETGTYADRITTSPDDPRLFNPHRAVFHGLDHMNRLLHRCRQTERISTLATNAHLTESGAALKAEIDRAGDRPPDTAQLDAFDALRRRFRQDRHTFRAATLDRVARDDLEIDQAMAQLDSLRWLHRVSYHLWRIAHHGRVALGAKVPDTASEALRLETED
ncbi:MAG: Na/Pi cotransporter family protein [Roseibium sp.]|nr:Na/Pi cotransporter family protein [Roseibium sp.]